MQENKLLNFRLITQKKLTEIMTPNSIMQLALQGDEISKSTQFIRKTIQEIEMIFLFSFNRATVVRKNKIKANLLLFKGSTLLFSKTKN